MRLTPLDIRKQEFTRAFRGSDAEEVQAFLSMLSNQWEEVIDDARRKDEKIREMESKLVHYEKVEEALQEALTTARETSRKALENAETKAQLIVERAEHRAEDIKREAEHERHQIKRETAKLSGRRSEIVTRLRAFLMSEMELLARFEGDDPVGFIKLLPAEEYRLHQLTTDLERIEEKEEVRADEPLPADENQDVFELGRKQEEEDAEEWSDEYEQEEEGEVYPTDAVYLETDL
ncbi:MAG: DivIVA domain-containing protein, partial [Rhodothermales bacterium]